MKKNAGKPRARSAPVPSKIANPVGQAPDSPLGYNIPPDNNLPQGDTRVIIIETRPAGSSGTKVYGGFFAEEYLINTLYGSQAADMYDKMRRSDANIRMLLNAVKSPIKASNWEIHPALEDDEEAKEHAEFIEHVLFHGMDKPFDTWRSEALTCVDFGLSVFEVTHKVVQDHPRWGTYIGIKQMGFRSQRSIQRWQLKPDGGIEYIQQLVTGDLGKFVQIPGEFLVVISVEKEGDNYEGVSLLRAAYGAWQRKQLYLKLMAIGIERNAVPTPTVEVPANKENTDQYRNLIAALSNLTSHQNSYLAYPQGWKVDTLKNNFKPEEVKIALDFENTEMTRAFLANFLELGITSSGNRALSMDQSLFFLGALQHIADECCKPINHELIPALVDMKYGKQEKYPFMKASGITDKAGKELSDSLKNLAESQVVQPDDVLEANVRKRMGLPKKSDQGVRLVQAPSKMQKGENVVETNDPHKLEKQKLAERLLLASSTVSKKGRQAKAVVAKAAAELKAVMKEALAGIAQALVKDIATAMKSLPESRKRSATGKVDCTGVQAYKAAVKEALSTMALKAINQARAEVPKKRSIKLSELHDSVEFADFDRLPPDVQARIVEQSNLIVESQLNDLKKNVFFQYGHSVGSTADVDVVMKDLEGVADDYIEGQSVALASSNAASVIVNEARNAFFFDEDVLEEVQAMQFVNGDPVCPLCNDLAGQVFEPDDPEAQRYFPPLHHNCACILVPILKSEKAPEITGLKPSKADLEEWITFSDEGHRCGNPAHAV